MIQEAESQWSNELRVEILAKKYQWDFLEVKPGKLMRSIDFLLPRIDISGMLKFRVHSWRKQINTGEGLNKNKENG